MEGWLHVSFPYLSPNGGWSSYKGGSQLLFSLRIKAPFTGSVTSCVLASCVGHLPPSLGTKDHPYKESWLSNTPSSQRGAPQSVPGAQVPGGLLPSLLKAWILTKFEWIRQGA